MSKEVKITASISTNPTFSERYFLDMRDVTNGRNRQLTTRHLDADGAGNFLVKATAAAQANGVELTFVDETGELSYLV